MSAININHKKETITTENDGIVKVGETGALLIGNGTTVNPIGNKGVLRFDEVEGLQISDGNDWIDCVTLITMVQTENLAPGAVTNPKIGNGEITEDKLDVAFSSDLLKLSNNFSDLIDPEQCRLNLGIFNTKLSFFEAGVDFIPGTTTQIELPENPGNSANLSIFFDGIFQFNDTFSLDGFNLTFNQPIPFNVEKIQVRYGDVYTTLITDLLDGSVTPAKLEAGFLNDILRKSLNLDTDITLSADSDNLVASQKATKAYVDNSFGDKEDITNKNVANGYAGLDGDGKIYANQLPTSVMNYLGTWNANINNPHLEDGDGVSGDWYMCSVAGTVDFGSGDIEFLENDWVLYNGTVWERISNSSSVVSVNGRNGVVTLNSSDIGLGNVLNSMQLVASDNLGDLFDVQESRNNLGLGSIIPDHIMNLVGDWNPVTNVPLLKDGDISIVTGIDTIESSGIDYVVGDILTIQGGSGDFATIEVAGVDVGGEILLAYIVNNGRYSVLPTSPVSVIGGFGSGAEFNLETLSGVPSGYKGYVYRCSSGGVINLGSGDITFKEDDWVYYNGSIWRKFSNNFDKLRYGTGDPSPSAGNDGDYYIDELTRLWEKQSGTWVYTGIRLNDNTNVVNTWTKSQIGAVQALSIISKTVDIDLSLANNFSLLWNEASNMTINNPTNQVAGYKGSIKVTVSTPVGSIMFDTNWKYTPEGVLPTIPTADGDIFFITFEVLSSGNIAFDISQAYKELV